MSITSSSSQHRSSHEPISNGNSQSGDAADPQAGSFPPGFLWGAATSAYQIEGASQSDGAGPSIWDRYVHIPGRVYRGQSGDVACNHYHRMEEDVRLMQLLGLKSYRFSISWSRVIPDGIGDINEQGLDFYDRLVDELLEADIQPMATLFHWDLPAALHDKGGWVNRESANWFAEYAQVMYNRLDDRVDLWATINEPWVIADCGYLTGDLAPAHTDPYEASRVAHNLLHAHGLATQAYRALGDGEIGLVVNLEPKHAATGSDKDDRARNLADAYINRYYLDPVFDGHYPGELREIFGKAWYDPPDSDFDVITQPLDFLGVNYYSRRVVAHDPVSDFIPARNIRQPQRIYTEMGWEVYPEGLTDTLCWVRDRYGDVPMYVTENGAAFYDPPVANNGAVHDPLRVTYLQEHLRATREAIRQGADVRGYYAWSLLDNFEWSYGYSKRFGIIHVNFATQERTLKDSAHFYREVIASNGRKLSPVDHEMTG